MDTVVWVVDTNVSRLKAIKHCKSALVHIKETLWGWCINIETYVTAIRDDNCLHLLCICWTNVIKSTKYTVHTMSRY